MTKRNEHGVDSPARRVKRFKDGAAGDEEVNTLSCVRASARGRMWRFASADHIKGRRTGVNLAPW
ncbi:hypothetical protein EYF80_051046 [Liparis tanakae]|uniref:Uncharacterized protein n=1 Tax=Liparis tanakae TaxID=230148 RepID=A0A4Z2FC64_9TELE|nr:hypothetical protein EYF80_051046 [Liparis tanakae]